MRASYSPSYPPVSVNPAPVLGLKQGNPEQNHKWIVWMLLMLCVASAVLFVVKVYHAYQTGGVMPMMMDDGTNAAVNAFSVPGLVSRIRSSATTSKTVGSPGPA